MGPGANPMRLMCALSSRSRAPRRPGASRRGSVANHKKWRSAACPGTSSSLNTSLILCGSGFSIWWDRGRHHEPRDPWHV